MQLREGISSKLRLCNEFISKRMTLLLPLILLSFVFSRRGVVSAIDPLQGIVKDFAYAARSTIQQVLNQFRLPKLGLLPTDLSFQSDVNENDGSFRCPLCDQAPDLLFAGTWSVVLWSRSFYLTAINDLNRIIDRLEAGRPISTGQVFSDLFAEPPEIRCPRLTVLNPTDSSKLEFTFQLLNGRQKSIVGGWERLPDKTFFWRIAPTLNARLCVAFTNMANQTSDYDFVVFNQIDSWPSCSNFIALMRTRTPNLVNNLRDFLEQHRIEGVFNKLEKVLCPYSVQELLPAPSTFPPNLPDDPFELPNTTAFESGHNNLITES